MDYKKEQEKVFNYMVNQLYFNQMNSYENNPILNRVEFIITPDCNLKCEYCYLYNYGDKLYPKEIRNQKDILNNLNYILNYFEKNNYKIYTLDLFSGEIWGSNFGIKILKTILNHYKKYQFSKKIVIPSNMSFLMNDTKTIQIEKIMNEFKNIGVQLWWSASIEGKIIEDKFRPFKDNNLLHTEDFYDRVFRFAKRQNGIGFHPMISSKSCKYWIENYKWFMEQFKNYQIKQDSPMMLEVRNDDWTEEDIQYYLKFLDFLLEETKLQYPNPKDLTEYLFKNYHQYSPIRLKLKNRGLSCALQHSFHIRLGDLAIVPCHRMSYQHFIYGHFNKNNNKIVMNNNPETLLYIQTMNPNINFPGCDKCSYKFLCQKGCLGAQYEKHNDFTTLCSSVCNLYKQKINFLIKKYEELGILKELENEALYDSNLQFLLQEMQRIKKGEKNG